MIFDDVRRGLTRLIGAARTRRAARQEKAESDIDADPAVAGSRAGTGEDGSYVGRESPQYDAEVQQSGAEARSEATRHQRDRP